MLWFYYLIQNACRATVTDTRRCTQQCACGAQWSRLVTHTITRTGSTYQRADGEAMKVLEKAFAQPPLNACPACGFYGPKAVAAMRSALWQLPFYFTLVWLGIMALSWVLYMVSSAAGVATDGLAGFVVGGSVLGVALVVARFWRQRVFDPNRDAAARRARLHDPLHERDITKMLDGIRNEASEEIDRATALFSALRSVGGWSIDGALAESLRRCLSGGRIPPSLMTGLRSLKTYGDLPEIDAWLGVSPLR